MDTHFVLARFDLDCKWQDKRPVYRIYVNDELFSEKEWVWGHDCIAQHILQVQAPPGKYVVSVQPVDSGSAEFTVFNNQIEHGPGRWLKTHKLIIQG
jgi:hypothetical protein